MTSEIPLLALAARQCGIVSRPQLGAAGMSNHGIRTRVRDGRLLPVLKVFRFAKFDSTSNSESWAAVLSAGQRARVTGLATLALLGLDVNAVCPTVVVPPSRNIELPGVRLLRDVVSEPDKTEISGLPSTSTPRAVLDAIRLAESLEADQLGMRALLLAWVSRGYLEEWVDAYPKHFGVAKVRRVLGLASTGAASHTELIAHRLLESAQIAGWIANHWVADARGPIGIVDIAFPDVKLAIEIDGYAFHRDEERFQRDRTRQNRLVSAGWTVLRFTYEDLVRRPNYVLQQIRAHLHR